MPFILFHWKRMSHTREEGKKGEFNYFAAIFLLRFHIKMWQWMAINMDFIQGMGNTIPHWKLWNINIVLALAHSTPLDAGYFHFLFTYWPEFSNPASWTRAPSPKAQLWNQEGKSTQTPVGPVCLQTSFWVPLGASAPVWHFQKRLF